MRNWLSRVSIVALLLMLPLMPSAAQDDQQLTTVVDVSDGYVISIPDGWEVDEDNQTEGMILSNDEITMLVLNPEQVNDLVDFEPNALDNLLLDVYDELYDDRPRRRDVEDLEIGGREAVSYSYEDGRFEGIFFVVLLSNGRPGAVDVYSEDVDIEDEIELITAIVTSFDVGEGGEVVEAEDEPAEPCFVRTDEENTVQLRVGPGENRSVISFLPAGEDFPVTGRFTADDDSTWYQLDKEEVLPNSAANEVWVAATDVETTGDCEAVVDASAPPIIPGQTQPVVEGDDSQEGGDTSETTAAIIPLAGRWTVNLSTESTASCVGTGTIRFDSAEIFPDGLSFTVTISSVASDGSSLILSGDRYILQSNGLYIGPSLFNLIDLDNSQTYLRVTSPTTMVGNVVANVVIEGRGCSQSTEMTLTRG